MEEGRRGKKARRDGQDGRNDGMFARGVKQVGDGLAETFAKARSLASRQARHGSVIITAVAVSRAFAE